MAVKTISGSSLVLSVDLAGGSSYDAIGGSTSCTLNVSQEAIDTTNKESSGRKAFINGVTSWTLDAEAFFTEGSSGSEAIRPATIYAALEAGTRIKCEFASTTGITGAKSYVGFGYITSLSVSASVAEWSTYSVSIQGDGVLTDS